MKVLCKKDYIIDNEKIWKKNKLYSYDEHGRKWIHTIKSFHRMWDLKEYVGCVSKEDNEKYKLGGKEMMGEDTYMVELTKDEFKNWQRTKMMDKMLNE